MLRSQRADDDDSTGELARRRGCRQCRKCVDPRHSQQRILRSVCSARCLDRRRSRHTRRATAAAGRVSRAARRAGRRRRARFRTRGARRAATRSAASDDLRPRARRDRPGDHRRGRRLPQRADDELRTAVVGESGDACKVRSRVGLGDEDSRVRRRRIELRPDIEQPRVEPDRDRAGRQVKDRGGQQAQSCGFDKLARQTAEPVHVLRTLGGRQYGTRGPRVRVMRYPFRGVRSSSAILAPWRKRDPSIPAAIAAGSSRSGRANAPIAAHGTR